MERQISGLNFAVNVHERLSRDFPLTPYNMWCRWVHSQATFSPLEKWHRILAWDLKPSDYSDPRLFSYDWQLLKLLSKLTVGGKITDVERDVAYAKFNQAEERCALVNQQTIAGETFNQWHRDILAHAKKTIAYILGDIKLFFDMMDNNRNRAVDEIVASNRDLLSHSCNRRYTDHACQFGPGSSVGVESSMKTVSEKIMTPTTTADHMLFNKYWRAGWSFSRPATVRGSTLCFVPKRVGEARTICFEPSMNMLTQLMVGRYLKQRLKSAVEIDLSDQKRNASLARLGSLCDSYCTIDLSSASDLISRDLMLELLPFEWYHLLDLLRSKGFNDTVDGSFRYFEKFSTMGNGFTFELESLIFYAVANAAIWKRSGRDCPLRELSIFGDDIIAPKEYYDDICGSLTLIGHIPNLSKSFASGPFRESCGGDFFNGFDVTAIKIKELNNVQDVVNLYNGLFGKARNMPHPGGFCPRYDCALSFIKRWLFTNYPKLSEGPIEYEPMRNRFGIYKLQPSNRWLFSDDRPATWRNVTWDRYHQKLCPKFVLSYVTNVTTEYDLSTQLAKYICQYGGKPVRLEQTELCFVRNPERGRPAKRSKCLSNE